MLARLDPSCTCLLLCDVQERFRGAMSEMDSITVNCKKLLAGAKILGVPCVVTEQYPKGLGHTIPELDIAGCTVLEKTRFSMVGEDGNLAPWGEKASNASSFVLMGLETHVCVQQTALDLLSAGKNVFLAVDCITSQRELDREMGFERMKQAGAMVTTSESILFDLIREGKTHTHFKAISTVIKEHQPTAGRAAKRPREES